jgi:hypothetical protein
MRLDLRIELEVVKELDLGQQSQPIAKEAVIV